MSIDRIGKGSAPPPPTPVSGSEKPRATEAGKTFEVHATPTSASGQIASVTPTAVGPLDRLRAGEIDLDGYLDLKVKEATAHLQRLRAAELEGIRSLLRDQLAGDPTLAELVQRATGEMPAAKG